MEEPKTQSVDDAAKALGIGRNQAYEAVRRGDIPAIRIGKRWLVLREPLTEWVLRQRLPTAVLSTIARLSVPFIE